MFGSWALCTVHVRTHACMHACMYIKSTNIFTSMNYCLSVYLCRAGRCRGQGGVYLSARKSLLTSNTHVHLRAVQSVVANFRFLGQTRRGKLALDGRRAKRVPRKVAFTPAGICSPVTQYSNLGPYFFSRGANSVSSD